MFRKIIMLSVCCLFAATVAGCGASDAYLSRTSEKAESLYFGENDCYAVTLLCGTRETPYASDGEVGEIQPLLSVKIQPKTPYSEGEEFSVSVKVGEDVYAERARFSPVGGKLVAELPVADVTQEVLPVTIYRNGESQTLEVCATPDLLSANAAIKNAADSLKETLSPHLSRGKFEGEVHARLTAVGESVYWFVTFIPKEGSSSSALLDAKTGEVLAVKGAEKKPQ